MKNKNIVFSIGSYVVAFIWFFVLVQIGSLLVANRVTISFGNAANFIVIAVFFVLLITGIFFGSKSNKTKESSWAGNLLMAVGIVIVLVYLLLLSGIAGGRP